MIMMMEHDSFMYSGLIQKPKDKEDVERHYVKLDLRA